MRTNSIVVTILILVIVTLIMAGQAQKHLNEELYTTTQEVQK